MLDIKYIVDHAYDVKANCLRRGVDEKMVDLAIECQNSRRNAIQIKDELIRRRKSFKTADRDQGKEIGTQIDHYQTVIDADESMLQQCLYTIPNLTHPDVQNDDVIVTPPSRTVPTLVIDHTIVCEKSIDFTTASTVTGSKHYYLKNELVILEQALIMYALRRLKEQHNFIIHSTPDMAKTEVLEELGFSPRGKSSQVYHVDDDLCLVGTAEITLGAMHRNEILGNLPLRYAGVSHCFRKEAGAAGKEGHGLFRVHQFSKVEMFAFCQPDQSEKMLLELLEIQKTFLEVLQLPYRVVLVGTSDLGNPAYKKYDLQVWMPSRQAWCEVTSASNCTDYQSRRLKTRYRKGKQNEFVHTLNATAIAAPRIIMAMIENHYNNGIMTVPPCLQLYLGEKCSM